MVTDPRKVLGVSETASQDEIKRAYRRKAKECHPDLVSPVFPKTRFSIMLSQASLFRFYRSGVQLFLGIIFTTPAASSIRQLLRC